MSFFAGCDHFRIYLREKINVISIDSYTATIEEDHLYELICLVNASVEALTPYEENEESEEPDLGISDLRLQGKRKRNNPQRYSVYF